MKDGYEEKSQGEVEGGKPRFGWRENEGRDNSVRCRSIKLQTSAPAGWFMKDWNLEAPADAAAPDIAKVEVGLDEREEGERAGAPRTSRTTMADDEWGDLC